MFPAIQIQMFEYNGICVIQHGSICNKLSCLYSDILVDTVCIRPEIWNTSGTVVLCAFDMINLMLQRVVFCRKFLKPSSDDRAICSHNRACTCTVDTKINSYNYLLMDICLI